MENKEIKVRIHFIEPILGGAPSDKEVYKTYIASKSPDASTIEDEVASVGVDETAENKMTVFLKTDKGKPFLFDYYIRGFFKSAAKAMKDVKGSRSSAIKAYKSKIDTQVFVKPRRIKLKDYGVISKLERPLRASTPLGERIALASSEMIDAGAWCEFTVELLVPEYEKTVYEWLEYGKYNGIGQWRNASYGRFLYELLDEEGNVIGGNYEGYEEEEEDD